MTRRTFKMQLRLSQGIGSGLIDIPHLSILAYRTPEQVVSTYEETWGIKPDGVVLPVTSSDGLLFEVKDVGLPLSRYAEVKPGLRDFQEVVQKFSSLGLDIFLLLDPTLQFSRTDALHVIDIVGDGSSSMCLSNPRAQELLAAILGTAVDEVLITTETSPGKLRGIAIDVVDLWPMGAADQRLEVTCFCASCERYFEDRKKGLLRNFRTFPNPWNLLLKESGTGISYIDDVRGSSSPEDILGLSRQKGFVKIFGDASEGELLEHARHVLDYIKVKHAHTTQSLDRVFTQALEGIDHNVARIIVTEGATYSWTSGLLLDQLDRADQTVVQEVWFDPRSSDTYLTQIPFRSYMWRRSRYYIDAFLSFAGNVSDAVARSTTGIGRLSNEFAKDMLRSRLNLALGTALTDRSALASLPELKMKHSKSQRIGFVGVALDREVGNRFIEGLNIPEGLKEGSKDDAEKLMDSLQGFMRSRKM